MRMQAWRLASTAQSSRSPQVVVDLVTQFDQSLALLKSGDASRPLFMPLDDKVNLRFVEVQQMWATQRSIWLGNTPPEMDASLVVTAQTVQASSPALKNCRAVLPSACAWWPRPRRR
jgi:two-component system nitrate/nitrite sensor histidine kinase NarX